VIKLVIGEVPIAQMLERRLIVRNRLAEGAKGGGEDFDAVQLSVHAIKRAMQFAIHLI
jgi:hypothetical protein